jgi:hypothetical protein
MREVSRFRLSDGGVVHMEMLEADAGPMDIGFRDHSGTYEARTTLGGATRTIGIAVSDMLHSLLSSMSGRRPAELEIEFGVQLSAEAGATIVRGADEGHFRIKATWADPDRRPRT